MSNQEQDPNMTPWPLFDFDDDTLQKSGINPNCSNNNEIIDSDSFLQLLDFDNIIDDVEPIKEGEPEAEGGGGGGGDNTTTTTRRSRGKRSMSSASGNEEAGNKKMKFVNKEGGDDDDVHEIHILTERERRKKMKNYFTELHALVPHLPSKVDKATILEEAVKYIKNKESELQKLEKRKEERLQLQQIQSASTTLESPTSQWLQYPYDHNNNNINGNNFVTAANTENAINNIIGTSSNNNNNNNVNYNNSLAVGFHTWSYPNVVVNTFGEMAQFCVLYPKNLRLYTTIAYVLDKYKIEINGGTNQFSNGYSVGEIFKQAAEEIAMWTS
ncbi:Transcription factor bHLH95 [Senna tora]|uniref:Transcription factor bHLH95 n=1 Tax=Senna tora TaxID=362788 RepID=A0A834XAS5_9FABA|nr:Transcription factor bHLH95 [Senna tora]